MPTHFHEYVEDLSRYWLASTISRLPTKQERRAALEDIRNPDLRDWIKSAVECLYKTPRRD